MLIISKVSFQEVVEREATYEINATWSEDQEEMSSNLRFIEEEDQGFSRASHHKLIKFLVILGFGIFKPKTEFLDAISFEVVWLLSQEEGVRIGENFRNPIEVEKSILTVCWNLSHGGQGSWLRLR